MRYLLALCPASTPPAPVLVGEPDDLPGGGLGGRSVEIGCWVGCRDTTHPLTELDLTSAVAFLRTEANRAEIAAAAPGGAGTPDTGRQTPHGGTQPVSDAVRVDPSTPPDAPRISTATRVSTGGAS